MCFRGGKDIETPFMYMYHGMFGGGDVLRTAVCVGGVSAVE